MTFDLILLGGLALFACLWALDEWDAYKARRDASRHLAPLRAARNETVSFDWPPLPRPLGDAADPLRLIAGGDSEHGSSPATTWERLAR